MQWFFAVNDYASAWFNEMAKVAVISAIHRTDLEPNCLFSGRQNDLTKWLESVGVKMHYAEVPFLGDLSSPATLAANEGSFYSPRHAAGAFLRTIAYRYASEPVFLYTDCDVMFIDGQIAQFAPQTIGAINETANSFNSGVMVINRDFFAAEFNNLVEHLRAGNFYFSPNSSYDQVLLNIFFKDRWTPLPPEFNWRPWNGKSEDASIIHFHGPKPHRIRAILDGNSAPSEERQRAMILGAREAYEHYVSEFYKLLGEKKILEPAI